MNLNWFKSRIRRYFEIDVKPTTNNTIGLCEDSNLSGLRFLGSYGHSKCDLRYIWNTGIRVDDPGYNKKRARYDKNSCRVLSTKTDTRGSPFFINRVENHYHNEIDSDVYSPLAALGSDEPGYEFPLWRRRLGIPNSLDESFLTPTAINHLTRDSQKLLTEIREYQKHYNQYLKKIESLPRIIDSIVKSKFIDRGVCPTISNNYKNIGCYYREVESLLEQVWYDYLHYIGDFSSYIAKNNIAIRTYRVQDNCLLLNGYIIGNGDCGHRDKMREVMNGLPQTQKILNALSDLHDSRHDLDRRIDTIQTLANPFLTQIRRGRYRTLCQCCPTQNPSIWDFG
jgi:hypothetical protein